MIWKQKSWFFTISALKPTNNHKKHCIQQEDPFISFSCCLSSPVLHSWSPIHSKQQAGPAKCNKALLLIETEASCSFSDPVHSVWRLPVCSPVPMETPRLPHAPQSICSALLLCKDRYFSCFKSDTIQGEYSGDLSLQQALQTRRNQ